MVVLTQLKLSKVFIVSVNFVSSETLFDFKKSLGTNCIK